MPLLVLPGPLYPTDISNVLLPILSEIRDLGRVGLTVHSGDTTIDAKVHLILASGDNPGR
jgi:hypothetical protein